MLRFQSVTKTFGPKRAVDDLNFEVGEGQVLGLLGPNGAGKSTSMKMACGYLEPTSGKIEILGVDVWKRPKAAKKGLGYLPEKAPLYSDFTSREYLRYIGQLRGLKGQTLKSEIERVVADCHLEPVVSQLTATLSKGYRHRLCLAQSLLSDPPVLIFDEPTDGLDPNQKEEIRRLILRIRVKKAIVVSTHILEEVEAVCSDVIILNHGQKVFEGSPGALLAHSGGSGRIADAFRTLTNDMTKEAAVV